MSAARTTSLYAVLRRGLCDIARVGVGDRLDGERGRQQDQCEREQARDERVATLTHETLPDIS